MSGISMTFYLSSDNFTRRTDQRDWYEAEMRPLDTKNFFDVWFKDHRNKLHLKRPGAPRQKTGARFHVLSRPFGVAWALHSFRWQSEDQSVSAQPLVLALPANDRTYA